MKKILKMISIILGFIITFIIIFFTLKYNKIGNNEALISYISNDENGNAIITNNIDKSTEYTQNYSKHKIDRYKLNDKYEEVEVSKTANKENVDWKEIHKEIVDSIYQYSSEIYISQNVDLMYWVSVAIENNIFVRLVVDDFDVSDDGHTAYIKYKYLSKEEHDEKIAKAEKRILDLIDNTEKANYNEFEKILSVYTYWATNIEYDDETEVIPSMEDVIFYNKGICQNYAKMIAYTLNQMNIEAYEIGGGEHEWNLVKIYDQYYHLDATFESSNGKKGLMYFGLSDKDMIDSTFNDSYTDKNLKATSQKLDKLREACSYALDNHILILFDENKNIIAKIDTVSLMLI